MKAHKLINQDSGDFEYYTPTEIIEAARVVMGNIDLDPASCDFANETVLAKKYYSKLDNGLSKEWHGNIWMNHPFGKGEISCNKDRTKCKKKICIDKNYSKYRGYHIDKDIPSNNV